MFRTSVAILLFILSCVSVYAEDNVSLIHFEGTAALPKNGYLFGTAEVETDGLSHKLIAFRKGDNIFALVPAEAPLSTMPQLNINALGFAGGNNILLGAYESEEGMGGWIMSFIFSGNDNVTIADYIKYGLLDGYVYDFYSNIPQLEAPKDIGNYDKDKTREIELDFYPRRFRMLVEIDAGMLNIDYLSPYYQRIFKNFKSTEKLDEYEFREYLLYSILTKRLTPEKALAVYMDKNKSNMVNIPDIIACSVDLKKTSTSLGVTNFMVEYLTGDITADMLREKLPKEDMAYGEFTEKLIVLDEKLKNARMDEEAFNDFLLFFSNSITESEFVGFANRSLVDLNGDIYSVLTNYASINKMLHGGIPLKIIKLTTAK